MKGTARGMYVATLILLGTGRALAADVEVDGVRVSLPVDAVEVKRSREFELQSAFLAKGGETRVYEIPRMGSNRILLSVTSKALHLGASKAAPGTDPLKMRDEQIASRSKKDSSSDLTPLTVAGIPAILQFSTLKDDKGGESTTFAGLDLYGGEANTFILLAYPEGAMKREEVRSAMVAAVVDPVRIAALQEETARVVDGAIQGARVNTQIGQFDFQDGTKPAFLKATMEATPETGLRTTMLYRVDRTTFWTGQRAVASFSCFPFVSAGSGKETFEEGLRKSDSVTGLKVLPAEVVDGVPIKRYEYEQEAKGIKLPTTVWLVEGKENTMAVTMAGYTTGTFRNQLGRSVLASSGKCGAIPGSTLDPGAPTR